MSVWTVTHTATFVTARKTTRKVVSYGATITNKQSITVNDAVAITNLNHPNVI